MSLDITPSVPASRQIIQSYGGGKFTVAGNDHHGSILIFAENTVGWPVVELGNAAPNSVAPLIERAEEIDIVLIGCGTALQPIPSPLRDCLKDAGITVELMDTGAACRTFNVLLSEDRRVAAALISVE